MSFSFKCFDKTEACDQSGQLGQFCQTNYSQYSLLPECQIESYTFFPMEMLLLYDLSCLVISYGTSFCMSP